MYAQLGDIIYEGIVGFQQFDHNKEQSYAEHALIENKPTLQKVGSKLDTVEIGIRFHKSFTDPETELLKLEDHANKGTILTLILGNGRIIGDFVINKIGESYKQQLGDGTIQCIEVSLSLTEFYSPNKQSSAQTQAINNGFANEQNQPIPASNPETPEVPSIEASESLVSGNANVQAAASLSDTLDANSSILKTTCQQMLTKVQTGLGDMNKLYSVITGDPTSPLYQNTTALAASVTVLIGQLTGLIGDIQQLISDIDSNPGAVVASIATVADDVSDVLDQLEQVKQDASKMAAMAALKK